jgi:hypothetical protein
VSHSEKAVSTTVDYLIWLPALIPVLMLGTAADGRPGRKSGDRAAEPMNQTVPLGRVAGIRVGMHWSVLVMVISVLVIP